MHCKFDSSGIQMRLQNQAHLSTLRSFGPVHWIWWNHTPLNCLHSFLLSSENICEKKPQWLEFIPPSRRRDFTTLMRLACHQLAHKLARKLTSSQMFLAAEATDRWNLSAASSLCLVLVTRPASVHVTRVDNGVLCLSLKKKKKSQ